MSREEFIKIRGAWDARHWVRVPSLVDKPQATKITQVLGEVPGIKTVMTYPKRQKIRVTYDQTKVNFCQIQAALEVADLPTADDWWSRSKAAWFQYLDQNAQVNANIPASPCCSNPTQILKQKKRRR